MCDWILSHYGKKILLLWRKKSISIKDISVFVYNDKETNKEGHQKTPERIPKAIRRKTRRTL